ncbi:MAG: hypothetical protein H0X29_07200 [Parachlamydiaceae bacterium]|nr:hypothetical protein [Parachlamydiaceae bacterium]
MEAYNKFIPTFEYTCPICMDPIKINDKSNKNLMDVVAHDGNGQKHPLHLACAKEAAIFSKNCPVCKLEIDTDTLLNWKERLRSIIVKEHPRITAITKLLSIASVMDAIAILPLHAFAAHFVSLIAESGGAWVGKKIALAINSDGRYAPRGASWGGACAYKALAINAVFNALEAYSKKSEQVLTEIRVQPILIAVSIYYLLDAGRGFVNDRNVTIATGRAILGACTGVMLTGSLIRPLDTNIFQIAGAIQVGIMAKKAILGK